MEIRFARVGWLRVQQLTGPYRTVGTRAGFVREQAALQPDSSVADAREQEVAPEKLCCAGCRKCRGGLGRTKPGRGSIGARQICQLVGVFIAPVCHELEVRGSVRDRSLSQPDGDIL